MNRRKFLKQLGLSAAAASMAPAMVAKSLADTPTAEQALTDFIAGKKDVLEYKGWTIEFIITDDNHWGMRQYELAANKPQRSTVRKALETNNPSDEKEEYARQGLLQWFDQDIDRLEIEAKAHYYNVDMPYEELQHSMYGTGY